MINLFRKDIKQSRINHESLKNSCSEHNNPKFYRSNHEKELSFNFSIKYEKEIKLYEDSIYNLGITIIKIKDKWIKNANNDELSEKIELCNKFIDIYNKFHNFCYRKGKGGTIYFQDMWEYCHNSKNPCFSYNSLIMNKKIELEQALSKIPK